MDSRTVSVSRSSNWSRVSVRMVQEYASVASLSSLVLNHLTVTNRLLTCHGQIRGFPKSLVFFYAKMVWNAAHICNWR